MTATTANPSPSSSSSSAALFVAPQSAATKRIQSSSLASVNPSSSSSAWKKKNAQKTASKLSKIRTVVSDDKAERLLQSTDKRRRYLRRGSKTSSMLRIPQSLRDFSYSSYPYSPSSLAGNMMAMDSSSSSFSTASTFSSSSAFSTSLSSSLSSSSSSSSTLSHTPTARFMDRQTSASFDFAGSQRRQRTTDRLCQSEHLPRCNKLLYRERDQLPTYACVNDHEEDDEEEEDDSGLFSLRSETSQSVSERPGVGTSTTVSLLSSALAVSSISDRPIPTNHTYTHHHRSSIG